MTQSDRDFITRIQVSQLMMGDPYQEDFYNQVYQSLVRNRSGPGEHAHPKHGTRTGRRQNALQRMEAQVERIINNVRLREKEKDLHCEYKLLIAGVPP
jgi:DNA topoisomerase 2-associated protein PAT1